MHYKKGGQLAKAVRRKPYSVITFTVQNDELTPVQAGHAVARKYPRPRGPLKQ